MIKVKSDNNNYRLRWTLNFQFTKKILYEVESSMNYFDFFKIVHRAFI